MSDPQPLFTVITVCRNAGGTLGRTLRSVADQTYPHIEYIVIDGASTDGSVAMIRACPAVTAWISEPDTGIAEAFNKGLARATGEWVGILNADDWYEPDALVRVIEAAYDADIVHGAVRYWESDTPKEVYYPRQDRLTWEMTISHPAVFVRRSVYEAEGGFDPAFSLTMDYELLLRLYVRGYRFKELGDTILANMRHGGASDRRWTQALQEAARAKLRHVPSPAATVAYCGWQLLRGGIRRACERLGLDCLVRRVRKHISPMRKECS
ncbi:MAG: glycosyltransferase [Deltaproteobacteria bacterium]|jgi:glycosyltransferase involved in cell wall biosynthesis|nr:glycosyltransferase [Deltaproteobacteria bacterium]